MTQATLDIFFAFFPYAGNGGTNSEHPSIREWFAATMLAAKSDKRVGAISTQNFSDTPITMTRNHAVLAAREAGADVLVMCDSDQHPDLYVGRGGKPFWESFDFVYSRKTEGKLTVVGAPYCGPPPNECCYVFKWTGKETGGADQDVELCMYPREEAAAMSGIQPVAALPTGLIMFDMEIFDVTDPKHEYKRLREAGLDRKTAMALTNSWFYYEYPDFYAAKKASTEDVTCTRDMGLLCQEKLGYNPLHCNWDAWAGHYKPKCVGKPSIVTADMVNEKYRAAVLGGRISGERLKSVSLLGKIKERMRQNGVA